MMQVLYTVSKHTMPNSYSHMSTYFERFVKIVYFRLKSGAYYGIIINNYSVLYIIT